MTGSKNWLRGLGAFGLTIGFLSANAVRATGNPHYSFWGSPLAGGGYVTAGVGLLCLACWLFSIPFPELGRKRWRGRPRIVRRPGKGALVLDYEDLKEIIGEARKNTQAKTRRELPFRFGRWMQLSVEIIDVGEWTGSYSRVIAKPYIRQLTVFMTFSDKNDYDEYLSTTKPKKRITVMGQIEHIEANSISLGNCSIVSIDWL